MGCDDRLQPVDRCTEGVEPPIGSEELNSRKRGALLLGGGGLVEKENGVG